MTLLTDQDRQEVQRQFEQLDKDVTVHLFTKHESPLILPTGDNCPTCPDARRLLEEVTALSAKLHLEIHEVDKDPDSAKAFGMERIPSMVITGDSVQGRLRYFGVPAGYEFPVLLGALIDVSGGLHELSDDTIESLAKIQTPVHIQVFVTPT